MIRRYEIFETDDGSSSVRLKDTSVSFHSTRGAMQESLIVFLRNGFEFYLENHRNDEEIVVYEVGFGTGLNASLTAALAIEQKKKVLYETIDLYPLPSEVYTQLNYDALFQCPNLHQSIMQAPWNQVLPIYEYFHLKKVKADFTTTVFTRKYDLIYFDAFAPDDQEEMWTPEICARMFECLNKNGILVTYCSKSMVRKKLLNAGFLVEKLPGPPGKREVIRAVKH